MTTISSNTNPFLTVPSTVSTSTAAATKSVINTATVAPTISTTNSSTVKVSSAALTVAKAPSVATPMSVAQILAAGANIPANTVIKDTAANISTNLKALGALTTFSNVSSITLSDTKAGTISIVRTDIAGDLSDPQNTDPNLAVLKKITSSYTLNVSGLSVSDALTLKSPAKTATLSLSISDTVDNIAASLTALQTAAKAKSIAGIAIPPATAGLPKANLSITAAQLKASPELLATIKGDYDLTITGVAAADAVTAAGNADKVLKASGSGSTQSKVAISDTSANLVKSLASLETAATAGRLSSITVSDSKALVLTEAQIKADSHFLATQFTSNTTVEATAVAAADVLTVQSLVNANGKLSLTKESIADTAANIQSNLDNLETAVKAPTPPSASNAFTIANIGITDKGSITVTNSTLVNDIDALKVLTGKYTLNVTDITVSDALAIKAPSKDATLAISVKDTAANIAANWDKLQAAVKAKTITAITVTDSASSLLSISAAQLKSDADALKVVTGDYKLSVTGVAAADVAKTLTSKNIYSVEVKDTAANILKNLTSIQTAVTAAKIQNVVVTDATNPSLSISDIFALTTTLPNVTLASGVKFNVKDTANMIIAHSRDDIGDVLKNAGTVTLTDKTPPNLTLADAITLKGIANLTAGTKYNVTDGGTVIAAQAALAGETVLSGAASVTINKNFTIADAKAIAGIKTLTKGTVYSITDTADNILAQSGVSGEKILSGANTVTVIDTSAKIIARLDQLEVLAKAGKIADIKFTDTPSAALDITQDQLVKDAEAIGKIVSQRTLPTILVTKPATPAPLGPFTFDLNLPLGSINYRINGINSNFTKVWGNYTNSDGRLNYFVINTDGTNLIDINTQYPNITFKGITPDGNGIFGEIYNGTDILSVIINFNSKNYINLTPEKINHSNVGGLVPGNNKIYGSFSGQNLSPHAFITNTDGTGFVSLTPQDATSSIISGFIQNGAKAWGKFYYPDGKTHTFICNTTGTNFIDLTPQNTSYFQISGFTNEGNKAWGLYSLENGSPARPFIINTDGTGFADLTYNGSTYTQIDGISPDGTKAWGKYFDQKNLYPHVFVSKIDGTDFVDITPQGNLHAAIKGITLDGTKAFGAVLDQYGQENNIFISSTDGSNLCNFIPSGASRSMIIGVSPDQSKIYGNFWSQINQTHIFISNTDGTGFVDLTPSDTNLDGSFQGGIGGLTNDGSRLWGINYNSFPPNLFIIRTDGTNFVDVTFKDAINIFQQGITNDGKLFGTYQTADQKWHGFTYQT